MHNAIAVLAGGLVLACVASLMYIYRHHRQQQAAAIANKDEGR